MRLNGGERLNRSSNSAPTDSMTARIAQLCRLAGRYDRASPSGAQDARFSPVGREDRAAGEVGLAERFIHGAEYSRSSLTLESPQLNRSQPLLGVASSPSSTSGWRVRKTAPVSELL
jgi:hypothetical protein